RRRLSLGARLPRVRGRRSRRDHRAPHPRPDRRIGRRPRCGRCGGEGDRGSPARGGRGSEPGRNPVMMSPGEREQSTRAEGDVLTIFERSKEGRRAAVMPEAEVPERPLSELIPEKLLRAEPPRLPEVSEPEI